MIALLQNAYTIVGIILTHHCLLLCILKYIYQNQWRYHYFAVSLIFFPTFIVSSCHSLIRLWRFDNIFNNIFFLRGESYLQISLIHTTGVILCAASLKQEYMTVGSFIFLSFTIEMICSAAFPKYIMHRAINKSHLVSICLAIVSYFLFDSFEYKSDKWELKWTGYHNGWKGVIYCILARGCLAFSATMSKEMILRRGFEIKVQDYAMKEEDKEKNFNFKVNPLSMLRKRADILKKYRERFEEAPIPSPETLGRKSKIVVERLSFRSEKGILKDENDKPKAFKGESNYIQLIPNKRYENNILSNVKPAEEERKILVNEKEKSNTREIETDMLLNDYEDLQFHMHFFSDDSDVELTRLDNIYDSIFQDLELIGIDFETSFELHSLINGLIGFPISVYWSFMETEIPDAPQDFLSDPFGCSFGSDAKYSALVLAVSVLWTIRPIFVHRLNFWFTIENFPFINGFFNLAYLIFSMFLVDNLNLVSANKLFAILLAVASIYIFQKGYWYDRHIHEVFSTIEAFKTYFCSEFEEEEINLLELRLLEIYNTLGGSALLRTCFDSLLIKDANNLFYTANPVMETRKLFDLIYYHRVSNWGGGLPRPILEPVENTWRELVDQRPVTTDMESKKLELKAELKPKLENIISRFGEVGNPSIFNTDSQQKIFDTPKSKNKKTKGVKHKYRPSLIDSSSDDFKFGSNHSKNSNSVFPSNETRFIGKLKASEDSREMDMAKLALVVENINREVEVSKEMFDFKRKKKKN